MANHVHFTIEIMGLDDEHFNSEVRTEKRTIKDWSDNDMEITEYVEIEHQPFMADVKKEFDDDGYLVDSYDWYCNNVGAKWCHIEECQDGFITGYSAWRQPHELVINIVEYLANRYDTCLSASMTYEDEFRNFMGKQYYDTVAPMMVDENYQCFEGDYTETDGDELVAEFNERFPDIDTDAEDFDWWEEVQVGGDTIYPNEVLDEIADDFWSRA